MWPKVAGEFALPLDEVRSRAAGLMDVIPDAFADAATDPDVKALGSALPAMLVEGVADRVAQCRKALD
jgi:hypothetical protein